MPRHILDRLKLISAYSTGQESNVVGPSALMVETTVRCNLLCPMCPRTGADYPNEDMPDSMIYPLLKEHAEMGGDHVYLYGLGEPLMDKRIFDLLAYCKSLGVGTILSSNGSFLNAERRKKLLMSGCDHLLLGLDGATESTYSHYRVGGKYQTVVRNIRALAEENARLGNPIYVVVQFIRMKENWHEQDKFLEQWSGVAGVSEVRIKDEDIGLDEHRTYEKDGHLRENPCHTLWRGPMVVRWNGDVFPCYHIASGGRPLGNLAESSLSELWNSPRMQTMRALHSEHRSGEHEHCKTCPAARPRLPLLLGAMALRGTTVRRLVPMVEKLAHKYPALLSEKRQKKGI
ncbi:MAG TPA: radical SAM protein [Myxococcales bacterium]|nr:radical SAM protein [Myxococcales bacterium]HIN85669.1 radical SAM protein [Myxococcales bacterium]